MTRRLRNLAAVAVLVAPTVTLSVAPAIAAEPHLPPGMYQVPTYGGGYGGGEGESYGDAYGQLAEGVTTLEQATTEATEMESAGVVLITTTVGYDAGEAAGTGLVLSADGVVVTNHHVVEGATEITVTDAGTGETYTAEVLGYDAESDVAVLQLAEAEGLSTVDLDDEQVALGDEVTAVGNAEGGGVLLSSAGSVTDASADITVSSTTGEAQELTDLIEVDAYVVSGDSGGALLDSEAEVIGMNVAASTGGIEVVGYAIAIDTVETIVEQILAGDDSGAIELGYGAALGVEVYESQSGLIVAGVVADGGAGGAGLSAGSRIDWVAGVRIDDLADLAAVLAEREPGDTVHLTWTDSSGTQHTGTAVLGQAPVG